MTPDRCEFCNTPVKVKGDTTKHYESDYERVCSDFDKEQAITTMFRKALESCVTLMSGAPTVAPMTDGLVLKLSREALAREEEMRK